MAAWITRGGGLPRERGRAAARLFSGALLLLAGCTQPVAIRQEPLPPLADLRDRTASNAQALSSFVATDAGWQAWLQAMVASQLADDALVDASTHDVPAWQLAAALTRAKDLYRRATSFYLVPVMMQSSCLNLASETNGAVRLPSGMLLRYRSYTSERHYFPNGSSCLRSTGFVSEVDSGRGMPIAVATNPADIDWQTNFARSLVWGRPFVQISQGDAYSVDELIALVSR